MLFCIFLILFSSDKWAFISVSLELKEKKKQNKRLTDALHAKAISLVCICTVYPTWHELILSFARYRRAHFIKKKPYQHKHDPGFVDYEFVADVKKGGGVHPFLAWVISCTMYVELG